MQFRRSLLLQLVVVGRVALSQAFLTTTGPRTVASMSVSSFHMAAPGVELSPRDEIQRALENPNAVVLDARRVDEIASNGFWQTDRQWAHAPCTPDGDCPILEVAAEGLIRDKTSPVIVYCASGKRASVAQDFLKERGYTTVLNAGGFPGDFDGLL